MNLLFSYVEHADLTRAMTEIVPEELDHFHQVRAILDRRGIRFYKLPPSSYGGKLHELVSKQEPQRAVDRLLVAGLIEARSCERFGLLRDRLADRELADFYGSLFESEARHHSTYVRLAKAFSAGRRGPRAAGGTGRGRSGDHCGGRGAAEDALLIADFGCGLRIGCRIGPHAIQSANHWQSAANAT